MPVRDLPITGNPRDASRALVSAFIALQPVAPMLKLPVERPDPPKGLQSSKRWKVPLRFEIFEGPYPLELAKRPVPEVNK